MARHDDSAQRDYHALRARQERERAAACSDSSAAAAHRTMAEEYDRRVATQPAARLSLVS